ncbi:MAG: hypothetical protein DI603_20735 [Roseateles depolymerans]|uniref:Tetratricopeptide repeat protein n=1 Tax=Roseateles depolymerans TaxID=76731 RepID=A0A2W5FAA6_9BURK|nr:MAG: hypothetical protein DI603_20735 [Roseateles depolymerans]
MSDTNPPEFMRFVPPDAQQLARAIATHSERHAQVLRGGDALALVDASADLAGLLTQAGQQAHALAVLAPHQAPADALSAHEPAAWFWCAYATALQYLGRRDEAEPVFAKAVAVARAGAWRRIEAMALHHWGRSLVEQDRVHEARDRFNQALALREALGEPSQASSRRALAALAAL